MGISKQQALILQQSPAYIQFISSLRSTATKTVYVEAIAHFLNYITASSSTTLGLGNKIKTCEDLLEIPPKQLQVLIIGFVVNMRDDKHLSPNTIRLRTAALQAFFSINDLEGINWKKVKKFQGEFFKVAEDRPYTREEIAKLLSVAKTPRDKAIILLFSSSGIRVGALIKLQLKHLKPISKYKIFMIEVYKKSKEQYITFCTPECRKAIENYFTWRKKLGEKLTPESPLFRRKFNERKAEDIRNNVKGLSGRGLDVMLERLRFTTGIIEQQHLTETIKSGTHRTQIMAAHGFRKHFASTLESEGVNAVYVEFLLGHNVGLKTVYSKPTEHQLLEGNGEKVRGYTAGINALTIDDVNRLKEENSSLKDKLLEYVKVQQEIDEIHEQLAIIQGQKQVAGT